MAHVNLTDAYKITMVAAGSPLATETFVYTHRKGGWQYMPFDPIELVNSLLPDPGSFELGFKFLADSFYHVDSAYRAALAGSVKVTGVPKGTWFREREPILTVTGPSALVSWLEPLILQTSFAIQVATEMKKGTFPNDFTATCREEADIVIRLASEMYYRVYVMIDSVGYDAHVYGRARRLMEIVGEDANRLFEVGLRAASCPQQHLAALRACKRAGWNLTSNVHGAELTGMKPVGTMGHEHIQRHGSSFAAFKAMRARIPGLMLMLPDTYDTLREGIPAAMKVLSDTPDMKAGIRFDSEKNIASHYLFTTVCLKEAGRDDVVLALESSYDDVKVQAGERLREMVGYPAHLQMYGIGGWLVSSPFTNLTRDRVSAVYKLSVTDGSPRMKFGDEPGSGKESIPGKPVLYRTYIDSLDYKGPAGYVLQEGEDWTPPVDGFFVYDSRRIDFDPSTLDEYEKNLAGGRALCYSPATANLRDELFNKYKGVQ